MTKLHKPANISKKHIIIKEPVESNAKIRDAKLYKKKHSNTQKEGKKRG